MNKVTVAPKLEINKELVLSTCHVTFEELQQADIKNNYSSDQHNTRLYVEGYLSDVSDNKVLSEKNPNMIKLLKLARVNGCKWLVLDGDGMVHPNLPKFNW